MKDYMMPDTIKQTRKVEIYTHTSLYLNGFKFFDGNNTLLFEVGVYHTLAATELIGADEQIIGVKAKLLTYNNVLYQAIYTDFQLMVCKRNK